MNDRIDPSSPAELRLLALALTLELLRLHRPRRPELTSNAGVHPREARFTAEDLQAAFLLGYERGIER